jgi:hypothetical protein
MALFEFIIRKKMPPENYFNLLNIKIGVFK